MRIALRMSVWMIIVGILWFSAQYQAMALTQNFDSIADGTALSTVPGWQAPTDYVVRHTSLINTLPGGNPSYPPVGYTNSLGVEGSFTGTATNTQHGAVWTFSGGDVVTNNGVFETKVRLSSWQNVGGTSIVTNPSDNSFMVLLGNGLGYDATNGRFAWTNAIAFAVYFLDSAGARALWYDAPGFDNAMNGTPGFGSSTSASTNWNQRIATSWQRDTYYTVRLSNIVMSSGVSTQATALMTVFESANPGNVLANNIIIRAQAGSAAMIASPFTNINQVAYAGTRLNAMDHFDEIYVTNFPVVLAPCPLPQDFESITDGTPLNSVPSWIAPADHIVRQTSVIDQVTNGVNYGSAGYNGSKGYEALFANSTALQGSLLTVTNAACSVVTNDGAYFQTQVRMSSWQVAVSGGTTSIAQNATGNGFALLLGSGMSANGGVSSHVNWTNATAFGVYFYDNGGGSLRVYTDRPGFDDITHAFPGFSLTSSGLTNWNAYTLGDLGNGWSRDTWFTVILSNIVLSTSSGNATGATARLWVYETGNPVNFFYTNTLVRSHIGSSGIVHTTFSQVNQLAFLEGRVSAVDGVDNIFLSTSPPVSSGPIASFTANPTSGGVPLNVNFTDTSSGSPTSWAWTFGDGGTSTAQNPSYAYAVAGTYTVTLIASNGGISSTNTQVNLINALTPLAAWQEHYFGCTNCVQALPTADPDGDGMNNTNEFLAGFNPTTSTAYLHIISIGRTNNNNDVIVNYLGANGDNTWSPGIASRTNVLEFTTGTSNGSYSSNNFTSTGQTNVLSGGNGLGTTASMTDPGGATNVPSRYYRVRVLLP
jgi:PKD repeat protein